MQYYDMASLDADLLQLKNAGAHVFSIGKSVLKRDIPCVFLGSTQGPQILIHASIHAREFITSPLVIEMMKNYRGSVGVWCVPMVNPDGVMLCQFGTSSVDDSETAAYLKTVNNDSDDFSQWKANANAVDLNVNFNADWGTGLSNINYPAPANYIGPFPVSEPETHALCKLTLKVQPVITLSYHTKGNVIFWGYDGIKPYPSLTETFSASTGYPLLTSEGSAGGYKDWFVLTTKNLGLTMEAGSAEFSTPIPLDKLPILYSDNKNVLDTAEKAAKIIWEKEF